MTITVLLKPNSRHRQEVIKNPNDTYTIYTKAPAIENRANNEAVMLLAKYFAAPKSRVKLVRGATNKHKVFEIELSAKTKKA